MYELFKKRSNIQHRQLDIPKLKMLRPYLQREMMKVVDYHRKLEESIDRQHLLVRLIDSLNLSYKRDDFSTESGCLDNIPSVAQQLGFVHPYNNNPVHQTGVFYNNNVSEVLVLQDFNNVSHSWLSANWRVANTIHIATHPFSDVDYGLCDGKYHINIGGVAVFFINVPALMIQFKHWCIHRTRNNLPTWTGIFVKQIVIPNMLYNHIDLCLFNRTINAMDNLGFSTMRRIHNISLADHTQLINEVCTQMANGWMSGSVIDPQHFYNLFPSVMKDTLQDSIIIPDIAPNVNTRWAMELAVLKYVDLMVRYYAKMDKTKLRVFSSKLKLDILSLENTKETRHYLSLGGKDYLRSIKTHINEGLTT